MTVDYTVYKVSFSLFYRTNEFLKMIEYSSISLIFMYDVRKCPPGNVREPLSLLRQSRDPMESHLSPRNIKILKTQNRAGYCRQRGRHIYEDSNLDIAQKYISFNHKNLKIILFVHVLNVMENIIMEKKGYIQLRPKKISNYIFFIL